MPIHDWTRVQAGIFHDFHNCWLTEVRNALNGGLLPPDCYALVEQHAGRAIADILSLQVGSQEPLGPPPSGGVAVAEAPPRVRHTVSFAGPRLKTRGQRRTVVVRHVSGHRVIALFEVVSPANKDRERHVSQLAQKVVRALRAGVHVLLIDLFRPGLHDPLGMHGAIAERLDETTAPFEMPAPEPLTFAAYAAGENPKAYLEHRTVGAALPEMPLFLATDRYVNVPLETTYQASYRGVPAFYRDILEAAR